MQLNPDFKYTVTVCIDTLDHSGTPQTFSKSVSYSLMDLYRFSLTKRLEREIDAIKEELLQNPHMVVLAEYFVEGFDTESKLEVGNGLKAFEVPKFLGKLSSMMNQYKDYDD